MEAYSEFRFYFEIRLGFSISGEKNGCQQFGCTSDGGSVICLNYNRSASTLSFLNFPISYASEGVFDSHVVEATSLVDNKSSSLFKIFHIQPATLEEVIIIGVGAYSSGKVFFTLNGQRLGTEEIKFDEESNVFTPYLRNLPRFLINFGQFDFSYQQANNSYSPTG